MTRAHRRFAHRLLIGVACFGVLISCTGVQTGASPLTIAGISVQTGTPISIDSYRGKVVLVNFWASWCFSCRGETPLLIAASKHLDPTVVFLGIDAGGDSLANARAFITNHQVPWPSIYDPSNRIAAGIKGVPPSAIPSTLILDRTGKVAVSYPRPVLYSEVIAGVARAETPASPRS